MAIDLYHYFDGVLSRLDRCKVLEDGSRGTARCPAHEDANPSLAWWITGKGDLCVQCYRGCTFGEIARALDCEECEFWRPKRGPSPATRQPQRTNPVGTWDYCDEGGRLLYRKHRWRTGPEGRGKTFSFHRIDPQSGQWVSGLARDARRVVYRLPELLASPGRCLLIPEGEAKCEALMSLGLLATCSDSGGGWGRGKWREEYTEQIMAAGPRPFVVMPDNDRPGREWAGMVAGSLIVHGAESVRVASVADCAPEGGDIKDVIEALAANRDSAAVIGGVVRQLIKAAPEWRLAHKLARAS